MDHKVSKDMISSGMIPSGEKTQADLGKTQYGSAPSPSKLMDAYKSMYDKKEEVINEMKMGDVSGTADFASRNIKGAKGEAIVPKPQDKRPKNKAASLPKPQDPATSKPQKDFIKARTTETPAPKPETKSMVDTVRDRRKEVVSARREKVQGIMNKYGESVDLLAAYHSIYEHHQKDKDGNTIPHEDEEVNEGKIPAGLQAYLDKKKGKKEDKKEDKKDMKEGAGLYANIHAKRKRGGKMRKKGDAGAPSSQDFANAAKTAKEEVDKFDVVFNHFINEGHSEKEAYAKMANLTEEQLDEFMKMLAAKAAQYGANLGQKTKIDAVGGIKRKPFEPVAQRKPFDAKPKPGEQGFKAKSASEVISSVHASRRKPEPITQKKEEPKPEVPVVPIRRRKKEVMQDEYQMKEGIGAALKTGLKVIKKIAADKTVQNLATQGVVSSAMNAGSGGPQKQRADKVSAGSYQASSADLFDIVKGQLLDEGLSEEEIKDIMLTLTPDEILSEVTAEFVLDASKRASAKSTMLGRQGDKQGMMDKAAQAKRLYDKSAQKRRAGNYKQGATPQGPSRIPTGEA